MGNACEKCGGNKRMEMQLEKCRVGNAVEKCGCLRGEIRVRNAVGKCGWENAVANAADECG